jgi:GxxExxY protein
MLKFEESFEIYESLEKYPFQEETYKLIGVCMEVHRNLGKGFLEVVYKDALQYELRKMNIGFEREKKFEIAYKDIILPHYYIADFVAFGKIIIEVKAQENVAENHYKQVINYLAVSKLKLGLIINFGEESLKFKRVALTK